MAIAVLNEAADDDAWFARLWATFCNDPEMVADSIVALCLYTAAEIGVQRQRHKMGQPSG
jgi:hypothetical protein